MVGQSPGQHRDGDLLGPGGGVDVGVRGPRSPGTRNLTVVDGSSTAAALAPTAGQEGSGRSTTATRPEAIRDRAASRTAVP